LRAIAADSSIGAAGFRHPGIGVITAPAITATIGDINAFKSGRHLAAWIGLVPRQSEPSGKVHVGKISGALFTEHAAVVG